MVMVPTYESQRRLEPTEVNPKVAATFGGEVADVGEGIKGLGDQIQKLDDRRQTLKAQTYMAKAHIGIRQMAATDPNIDNLDERVDQKSQEAVSQAADLIKSPQARNTFIASANLDIERRNAPVYNTILRRKSQDFKNELVQANDADVQDYQGSVDPGERNLIRQNILDRTNTAVQDGHVNADWARIHATTLLKSADINQVKNDMSINASATYEQLQKGKEGLYPYLNESQRKQFADKAQKMVVKEGSDNKLIYGIAQNHSENTILDKMAKNTLTQDDINNAQLIGVEGIRIRPEFAKAATEALQDPFPTESVNDKYMELFNQVTDPTKDAAEVKLNIMRTRGLSPQQKAHLINGSLRQDESGDGTKQSIGNLIQSGIKKNKQDILELNRKIQMEVDNKRSLLGKIGSIFSDHAKDDTHLIELQQQLMDKSATVKNQEDLIEASKEILNKDTIKNNPKFSSFPKEGKIMIDSKGNKAKVYPDGSYEAL